MAGMTQPSSLASFFFSLALNAEGAVPSQLVLLRPGTNRGRDGRAFLNDQPDGIVADFTAGNIDVPIDIEHATELRGPKGEPAPAQGWIKKLTALNGELIADVEWTEHGAALVAGKAYRYISPAFLHRKDNGRITRLLSVGLTNKPNLDLPSLNNQTLETDMDRAAIAAALGIAATATDADVITAINSMRSSLDRPDPNKFVPKADLDAALNRATTAEQKLADQGKQAQIASAVALVDQGVKDGKIAPASRDHYLAICRQDGGLAQVEALLKTLPNLTDASGFDRIAPGDKPGELTAAQKALCAQHGISEDDFKKELAANVA
jgi:phage I-like protein